MTITIELIEGEIFETISEWDKTINYDYTIREEIKEHVLKELPTFTQNYITANLYFLVDELVEQFINDREVDTVNYHV